VYDGDMSALENAVAAVKADIISFGGHRI